MVHLASNNTIYSYEQKRQDSQIATLTCTALMDQIPNGIAYCLSRLSDGHFAILRTLDRIDCHPITFELSVKVRLLQPIPIRELERGNPCIIPREST